jgi:hypothetical protein
LEAAASSADFSAWTVVHVELAPPRGRGMNLTSGMNMCGPRAATKATVLRGMASFEGLCVGGSEGSFSLLFFVTSLTTATLSPQTTRGNFYTSSATTPTMPPHAPFTRAREICLINGASGNNRLACVLSAAIECTLEPMALKIASAPLTAIMQLRDDKIGGCSDSALASVGRVVVEVVDSGGRLVDGIDGPIIAATLQPSAPASLGLCGVLQVRASGGRAVFDDLYARWPAANCALAFSAPNLATAISAPLIVLGPTQVCLLRWPAAAVSGQSLSPNIVAGLCNSANGTSDWAPAGLLAEASIREGTGGWGGMLTGSLKVNWKWDLLAGRPLAIFTDLAVKGPFAGYQIVIRAQPIVSLDNAGATLWEIEPAVSPPFDVA